MQNAVRIVVLDYYMSAPIPGLDVTYSEFRAAAVNQLPILRCFGSTENGKKICVHIHGVFPYLYIPYDGKSKPEELMYQIAAALDKAINVSFNQASSSTQHVYKISLVSGIPMYGYHSKTHQFFKIYLYNPALVTKVGSILLNKNILEQVFQPHEIHLNFTLQFMIDYNLHGMSNMLISEMKYRINSDNEISDIDKHLFLPANIEKTSLCELEADINAENIINRQEVLSGNIAINPGITALWEDEKQRRRNKNEDSQLGSFLELKNMFSSPTKTHLIFQQALKERLAVLSTDKDIPKPSPDVSVYPAETPVDSSIQNASFINIQSASSLELSLDDTLSVPYSQDHNETITPDGNSLNVTMDEDAQDFLHLLQELAEEKMMENEEGSILSQTVPEDQSDDSTEDFLDLSMPLASLTTPIKADVGSVNQKSDDEDTDCFNTTLIPQIDGQIECSNIDDEPSSSNKKTMFRYPTISNRSFTNNENAEVMQQTTPVEQKRNSSMPLLNINNITTDFSAIPTSPLNKLNLVPYVKLHRMNVEMAMRIEPLNVKNILKNRRYCSNGKIKHKRAPDDILDDTLRLVRYRMNRINSKSRIKNVGKVLRLNDDYSMNLLKKASCPKFKILPGKKWFLDDGGGDSHTSEKEDSPITDQSDCAKRIRKRRRTVPNMYINCDGAADSSSDDEQTSKRKAIERKLRSSQYMPLGIIVTKSPKVHEKYKEGIEHSLVEISGNCKHSQECASQVSHQDLSNTNIPFKRKLDFEEDAILNSTISEELISCVYSSNHISNTTQTAKENTIHISQKKRSIVNRHENCNDYKLMEDTKSQSYDSTSSDSDLFLENDDLNKSFFKSYNLTLSEKYDKENKYQPKEGCSTVLSGSISLSNSSIRSQINQVLSSSTSSDIPPYQEISQAKIILRNQSKKIAENIRNNENTDSAGDQKKTKTIKPTFKAPSRLNVALSLTKYKIPHIQQQEPYYSNVDDYTGVVEIGHRVMRIASKTTAHLSEFDSEFNGLNNHRKYIVEHVAHLTWNSNNIKSLKLTHCSTKTVIVQPLKKPPSGNQVKEWIKVNSKPREERTTCSEAKTEPIKMYIPNSPGNDSDLDMSLSLTPYTTSQSSLSDYTEKESTKSLSSFQSTSPALDHRNKKYKNKTLDNKPPDLKDSILLNEKNNNSCQITGISQRNSFGFDKSVQNLQAVRALAQHQYLTTMVMELHIRTRGDLKPDPQFDNICAIFYSILNDVPDPHDKQAKTRGVIAVNCLPIDLKTPKPDLLDGIEFSCDISYVETEEALINNLISVIKFWDPDILAGYETEMLSWGYLVERSFVLSINILPMLGRSQIHKYNKGKLKSLEPELETSIIGRIVLNVWRIMRHEIALQSYTFESIVYHILHRRIPLYAFKELTFWWDHHSNLYRHRAVRYYLQRADTVLELFEKLDFLNRTSELARLFGILFYEVLSRGSQFRVESMMLRLAKPLNYVPVSPDVTQRANMKAPEFIPLVMEPESKLYSDPVIVLDFQSLYPSIIIAYNYCFTTCIGRVNNLGTNYTFEFGATQLKVPKKITEKLCKRDLLNYSPAGVAFVKQKVREGILPRMLKEVLDTRLMVKNSMKENKGNSNLQKVLHNRQLGLKLIANVTYGYTAANFSGRMCCVEVGDSVVSKGRETLQRAIALVESTPEWESRVVYGDTDSMFVLVPGKTKEEAFEIGRKIADAVTADNPDPIKLKLEKVYQPCILQTKKRYVGYMYESPEQKEPIYEAKGIETVRRDGCPAVAKMLQKCLTLLFETKNVSLIKNYVLKQFNKIQTGRASIQDLTFAKEYRGASGYKPGACVPALELAQKWKAVDRRNVPRSGERVPYVIVNGPPGLPLIRLVKSPRDLLNDSSLRPNALYYITKVIIPPINRCLNLIGADLNVWFNQMPRKNTQYLPNSSPVVKNTISQYFATKICASCSAPTQDGLCPRCRQKINVTTLILTEKLRKWEENYNNTLLICQSCTGHLDEIVCTSLDCPVLYRRIQTFNDLQQSTYVRELLADTSIFSEDNFFER